MNWPQSRKVVGNARDAGRAGDSSAPPASSCSPAHLFSAELAPAEDDLPAWAIALLIPVFGLLGGLLLAIAIADLDEHFEADRETIEAMRPGFLPGAVDRSASLFRGEAHGHAAGISVTKPMSRDHRNRRGPRL